MRRGILITVTVGLAGTAAGFALWRGPAARTTPDQAARPGPGPVLPGHPAAPRAQAGVTVDRDPSAVFQRAFWRRVGPDVRVVEGERREARDAGGSVQKWEWFVALETTPDFRRWLLEHNPFELTASAAPVTIDRGQDCPAWFPSAAVLAGFTAYGVRGSHFAVFLDPRSGRMFATDRGAGFTAAR
jgi:hypothetical protein